MKSNRVKNLWLYSSKAYYIKETAASGAKNTFVCNRSEGDVTKILPSQLGFNLLESLP